MKILIISTLYHPHLHGGSEKAATLLAETLAAKGHSITVVTLHPETEEAIESHNGVRIYRLPLDNLYWPFGRKRAARPLNKIVWHVRDIWNLRAARRIGRILDIERPDAVHSHSIAGFSAAALREVKRRDIRLIHTIHDYYLLCLKSSMFKNGHACEVRCKTCIFSTFPRKLASNYIDAAVPVSRYVQQQHTAAGYLHNAPTHVLPNINRAPAFSEAPPDHSATRHIVFGYIGRIEPHKGIEVLLKACASLQHSEWKLRIAGHASAEYLHQLQRQYPNPCIDWIGFTDAPSFFRSIDICIVPSLWPEPQPYVVIEALEANKSLITSNSGGLPEMAAFAKRFVTFPTGNREALTHILNDAQLHPQAWRCGGFLSQEVRDRFQPQHILAAHESLYRNRSPKRISDAKLGTNEVSEEI